MTKIDEMHEFECLPTEESLTRSYLTKMTDELTTAVMSRKWKLDGTEVTRLPRAWQEIAGCVVSSARGGINIEDSASGGSG